MKKLIAILLTSIMVVCLCCGCSTAPDDETPDPVATTEPIQPEIQIVDPQPDIPIVLEHRTPAVEWPVGYTVGEQIWVVIHSGCCGPAEVRTGTVIAEVGPYAVVAPMEYGSGENLEDLFGMLLALSNDEIQSLDLYPFGDCYRTQEEAEQVVNEENSYE